MWVDDSAVDAPIVYVRDTNTHQLTVAGYGSTVVVDDYEDGDLGISMPGGTSAALPTLTDNHDYRGDVESNLDGLAGNDVLSGLNSDSAQHLSGGAGDDLLFGNLGNDTLDGGGGNDFINGGAGRDLIFGGAGSDLVLGYNYQGIELVDENKNEVPSGTMSDRWSEVGGSWYWAWQAGWDQPRHHINYHDGAEPTSFWEVGGTGLTGVVRSTGAAADTSLPDTIFGGGGDDFLAGTAGNDYISGDADADVLFGNAGNDMLFGGSGTDELSGDDGDDYLDGETQDDKLFGGYGSDSLRGGSGADELVGDLPALEGSDAPPTETDFSRMGDDYLDGEDGNDSVWGGGGNDTLYGGSDNDQLQGDGIGTPEGYQGKDYLDGEDGKDTTSSGVTAMPTRCTAGPAMTACGEIKRRPWMRPRCTATTTSMVRTATTSLPVAAVPTPCTAAVAATSCSAMT